MDSNDAHDAAPPWQTSSASSGVNFSMLGPKWQLKSKLSSALAYDAPWRISFQKVHAHEVVWGLLQKRKKPSKNPSMAFQAAFGVVSSRPISPMRRANTNAPCPTLRGRRPQRQSGSPLKGGYRGMYRDVRGLYRGLYPR